MGPSHPFPSIHLGALSLPPCPGTHPSSPAVPSVPAVAASVPRGSQCELTDIRGHYAFLHLHLRLRLHLTLLAGACHPSEQARNRR